MKVGIHYDGKIKWSSYTLRRFKDILHKNNIKTELMYLGSDPFWEKIAKCDLFIYQWLQNDWDRQIAPTIINIVENEMGIKCYPNWKSSWLYDNKIRQFYILKVHGYPVVDTHIFYDYETARKFIERAEYPLVFKLTSGAGSRTVRMIKDRTMAKKYVKLMFREGISYKKGLPGEIYDQVRDNGVLSTIRKRIGRYRRQVILRDPAFDKDWSLHKNYIFLQKFLPDNAYDTRVAVIGKRAAAFQRINRENDFRASGSKDINFTPDMIDINFIKIAFDISKRYGFDSMAYDFVYDEDKNPALIEISYTFGSSIHGSQINKCPGYWDDEMKWHESPIDVEHAILSDLLSNYKLNK